jgi:hypothetical protein
MLLLREGPPPYQRRGVLLPADEIPFFRALQAAVRDDWVVFSRVPLAEVLKVRRQAHPAQGWQRRLGGKHLDYVLCDPQTLEVKLAIQVAGTAEEKSAKHEFVILAMAAAGLPLLRVTKLEKPEPAAVRKEIEAALGIARKRKRA